MERLESVFSMAKVAMDTYKSRFDKATAKKKKSFEDLNKNYVPGSPVFIAERDKIAPEYKKEVDTARGEALKAFEGHWSRPWQKRGRTQL